MQAEGLEYPKEKDNCLKIENNFEIPATSLNMFVAIKEKLIHVFSTAFYDNKESITLHKVDRVTLRNTEQWLKLCYEEFAIWFEEQTRDANDDPLIVLITKPKSHPHRDLIELQLHDNEVWHYALQRTFYPDKTPKRI